VIKVAESVAEDACTGNSKGSVANGLSTRRRYHQRRSGGRVQSSRADGQCLLVRWRNKIVQAAIYKYGERELYPLTRVIPVTIDRKAECDGQLNT